MLGSTDGFATLLGIFMALSSGQAVEGPDYRIMPVYEVWATANAKSTPQKYSDAPTKDIADKVAKSLKVLGHTADVRGPVLRNVGVQKQLKVTPNTDTSPLTDDDLSGAAWFDKNIYRYPTSKLPSELAQPFRGNFERFQKALTDAGASVTISVTYRSEERAYLMHYAYKIAHGTILAKDVPAQAGVRIKWVHATEAQSKAAAAAMVAKFGIAYPPAFPSNHSARTAVDMKVTWTGTLKIKDATGPTVEITTTTRTGAGNTALHTVGATFGVFKLVGDAPHWSANGH